MIHSRLQARKLFLTLICIELMIVYVTGAAVLETVGYKMLSAGVSLGLYRVEVAAEEIFRDAGRQPDPLRCVAVLCSFD
jgi:hypothetical protein